MGFKAGQHVFHSRCGVCLLKAIEPLPSDPTGPTYYVLSPLYGDDKGNIVRVPTATATTLSETLTEKQAKEIIKNWPDVRQDLYIKDSKLRKTTYENTLKTGNVVALAPLLEGAFQRKARDGHLNSLDAQFVAKAVPLVYGALAQSLGIEYGDVPEYIVEHRSY
ncbi:MAG: hypothetical protein II520_03285 [Bacilli bacterium]|jgi:RNA polymerase-interacting CarD/CdnL/TRCF family regulator|nr:hypothetical protein [Bacilli bacterium]